MTSEPGPRRRRVPGPYRLRYPMRKALIIVNPRAGEQRPERVADRARAHLERGGWSVAVAATQRAGHATELAAARGRGLDRVVVVGGDGTLRETVAGLAGEGPAVALVPIGKANVVARELGIPLRTEPAIAWITDGIARSMDVGTVGDAIFLAMVGVGYDAAVTEGVRRLRRARAGSLLYNHGGASAVYALAGLPPLLPVRRPALRVVVDDRPLPDCYRGLIVSNTETYATGWSMTPGADPGDGCLDHQANRRTAPWFVLWTLVAAASRRRLPSLVADYGRGRRYLVQASVPFPWQLDGDSMPRARELRIGVRPRYVRILVPAEPAAVS